MMKPPSLKMRTAGMMAAMTFLAVLSRATFGSNVPTALSPYSFAVVIPLLQGGSAFAVMVMPFLFFLWSMNLVDGRSSLPVRSVVLSALVSVGVIIWFVIGWSNGIEYQGIRIVIFWAAVNAIFVVLMAILAIRFRSNSSWWRTLLFQWLLFAWPAWCGFPWLGELI